MNPVERRFAELTNKWLKRGTHHSVKEPRHIDRDMDRHWNNDPKSFIWHKTADEMFDTIAAYCQRISNSGH